MIRRQQLRRQRKPLVLMSPKSLLRHPKAVSSLDDLAKGRFQTIIPDEVSIDTTKVKMILLTSGKLYYELEQHRRECQADDFAIIRMEQLYPIDDASLSEVLQRYDETTPVRWVQDEPMNMGAWPFMQATFGNSISGHAFSGVCREASASPATGSSASHKLEQRELLQKAFASADEV